MKIKRLTIYNFSSYLGTCAFDFNVSKNKTVILIGGQNGTGKTSLFTALKLALYGHLCFNYQSDNGQYFSKVKELINHDTFTTSEVKAFIEVEIEIPNEREFVKYTIKREWEYNNQKLSEKYYIYNEGNLLAENEVVFFQNYLFTVLPPNLFDFFFFDGERIADFFATSSYNSYIKNALLTLCSFDTFEIIRKFCYSYVNNKDNSEEIKALTFRHEDVGNSIVDINAELLTYSEKTQELENDLMDILSKKEELELHFKTSGGLSESEKDELLKQSRDYEREKNECNLHIKSFVENMMPFIIARNTSSNIGSQLLREDETKKYFALQDKLNSPYIAKAVKKTMKNFELTSKDNGFVKELTESIALAVKPDIDVDNFVFLHDLSKEQQDKVNGVLNIINEFSDKSLLEKIKQKEKATKQTTLINKKLREAMSDIDTESYSQNLHELTKSEFEINRQLENIITANATAQVALEQLQLEYFNLKEQLKLTATNKNIYELTGKINTVMDNMIKELTITKFKQIETLMLGMLKKIMRKGNYIDLIELDSSFNIYLYKEQTYQFGELENLIKNVGHDELAKRIGNTGVKRVLDFFSIDSVSKLKNNLKKSGEQINLFFDKTIELYKKIEFNQLSKGEKQIFILSLYYAIIKVSGKDIPFIIDTPYARIDAEHREQISKEFFPSISSQVIILSTDEEITKPYYDVLKPFISKEYVLRFNEKESKTTVSSGYFFGE